MFVFIVNIWVTLNNKRWISQLLTLIPLFRLHELIKSDENFHSAGILVTAYVLVIKKWLNVYDIFYKIVVYQRKKWRDLF